MYVYVCGKNCVKKECKEMCKHVENDAVKNRKPHEDMSV